MERVAGLRREVAGFCCTESEPDPQFESQEDVQVSLDIQWTAVYMSCALINLIRVIYPGES